MLIVQGYIFDFLKLQDAGFKLKVGREINHFQNNCI